MSRRAWILAMGVTLACEREGAAPTPSPPTASASAPTPSSAAPPAAIEPPSDPAPAPAAADPGPAPADPAVGDPAQVERVLAEYHHIERLLRPRPEDSELSKADRKLLHAFLGEKRLAWYEVEGGADTVRQAWLEQLSKQAATEPPSTIRMPLYPNVGWGCEVPSEWVATGNFNPDCTFILPVGDTALVDRCMECYALEDDDRRETCIPQRCSLQVQGHFTGKTTKPTAHCEGIGHEFHIERATANGAAAFFLALPGGAAPPDGPPITEGPRFGVLFASAFRHEQDARARADALQARLVEKGHASAQVLDSRRIPTLWCCSFAVLVERFDDEKAAKTLAKALKREGFEGALVRTLY